MAVLEAVALGLVTLVGVAALAYVAGWYRL
jgi:hypothetical protein